MRIKAQTEKELEQKISDLLSEQTDIPRFIIENFENLEFVDTFDHASTGAIWIHNGFHFVPEIRVFAYKSLTETHLRKVKYERGLWSATIEELTTGFPMCIHQSAHRFFLDAINEITK